MNRFDSVTAVVWFLVGLGIILWSSLTLELGTLKHPGSGFLPLLCGATMAFLAIIVFFQAKRMDKEVKRENFWTRGSLIPIFSIISLLLIYAFFLDYLGFKLTTFIVMLLILTQVAGIPWFMGIVESLIITGACYLTFDYLMRIQLPKGWLGF